MARGREGGVVPWPVWAMVTVLVAVLGVFAANPDLIKSLLGAKPAIPDRPLDSPNGLPNIGGKYFMDQLEHRVIVVTKLAGDEYRIEEPSGSWPWQGIARLDGGFLSGEAQFRTSLATMKVEGNVRADRSIAIEYRFITDGDGKPAGGRVDRHVWYPAP
jgi:hypothetical protein